MKTLLNIYFKRTAVMLFCAAVITTVSAGEITYPDNSYSSGDTLTASDLNDKFNEIKTDVNDNNSRSLDNQNGIAANEADIQDNMNALPGVASSEDNTCCTDIPTTPVTKQSVVLTPPGSGYAIVTYTGHCRLIHVTGSDSLVQSLSFAISTSPADVITSNRKWFILPAGSASGVHATACSTQAVFPISGATTYYLNAVAVLPRTGEAGEMGWGNLHALFVPNLY